MGHLGPWERVWMAHGTLTTAKNSSECLIQLTMRWVVSQLGYQRLGYLGCETWKECDRILPFEVK